MARRGQRTAQWLSEDEAMTRAVAPERPPPALIQPSVDEDPRGYGGSGEVETGTQLPAWRSRKCRQFPKAGRETSPPSHSFLQPSCRPHCPLPGPTLPPFSSLASFPPSGPAPVTTQDSAPWSPSGRAPSLLEVLGVPLSPLIICGSPWGD